MIHLSSVLWVKLRALQKLCSTGHKRPRREQKERGLEELIDKSAILGLKGQDPSSVSWPANCLTHQSSRSYGTQPVQEDAAGRPARAGRFIGTRAAVAKTDLTRPSNRERKDEPLHANWQERQNIHVKRIEHAVKDTFKNEQCNTV